MKLYSYWRSSTSFRVRAALNLKRIEYRIVPVDLLAGAQKSAEYKTLNPNAGVPTLKLDDGTALAQSLAIIEYLDAVYPQARLLPDEPLARAETLAVAHSVGMDIHPLNNTRVIGELKTRFGASDDDCRAWMHHWMATGFSAIEQMLPQGDDFAFGEKPNVADLCIVAQGYNAHRWGLDLAPYPAIQRIEKHCLDVPEIAAAHPDNQPEANA